jgi:hypothetical protein
MLAKVKRRSYRIEPSTALASPTRAFTLPEAFDVRFYFRHPQALAIDAAAVRLTVADAKGRRAEQALTIPIGYYQQKTALTLPIRGKGVFGQDWITIAVKAGDRVATGQVVGRLGNSGDSFGPHLHYQLQSGPRLFEYPSLPFRFQDLDDPLSRGRQFEAK